MKPDPGWRVANHSRWLWALLEIGFSICIINIISWQLTVYYFNYYTNQWSAYACLLGTNDQGENLCEYGYAIACVSMGVTFLLMCSACCQCRCFAYSNLWTDIILTLFCVVWWLVASILMVEWNNGDNRQTNEAQNYVNAIIGLAWTSFAIYLFDFLGCVFMLMFVAFGKFGGAEAHAKWQAEQDRVDTVNQQYMATMGAAAAGGYAPDPYQQYNNGTHPPVHMGGSPAYAGPPPGYGAPAGWSAPPPGYGAPAYGTPAPAGYPPAAPPAGYPSLAPVAAPAAAAPAAVIPPTGVIMAPNIDLGDYKPHK